MPESKPRKKKYGIGGGGAHGPTVDLELPSLNENGEHNVCLVRRIGVQGLIKMNVLDSFDTLTNLVSGKIAEITSGDMNAGNLKTIAEASPELKQVLVLLDRITLATVVEPKVYPVPEGESESEIVNAEGRPVGVLVTGRNPDRLYVDDVDLEDKLFIMQFVVGGSADLSEFRGATSAVVGGVEDVEDVRLPTE
jgi:hypothetical protein